MEVVERLCIKPFSITAQNGDHWESVQGKFYTTSVENDGKVVVFSNFWVTVPADHFVLKIIK